MNKKSAQICLLLTLLLTLILGMTVQKVDLALAKALLMPTSETYTGHLAVPLLASECSDQILVTQGYNGSTHTGDGDKYAFDMQCIGIPNYSSFTYGKTVIAAADGWAYAIGDVVLIDHGTDYYTQYVHVNPDPALPSYDLNFSTPDNQVERAWVNQGDVVATVGTWPNGNHLHFEIAKWLGNYRDIPNHYATSQYWGDVALGHMGSGYYPETDKENAYRGSIIDGFEPNNEPPNPPILKSPTDEDWVSSRSIKISWQDSGDPDNQPRSYRDYYAKVWKVGWSKTLNWTTSTSWQVMVPENGSYFWQVKAGDGAASSDWSETRTFHVDASPPQAPAIFINGNGCNGIQNNDWQNKCNDPDFTWNASDVGGSGIKGYYYCWSTNANCLPSTWTTATSFDPVAIAPVGSSAKYYLNVKARDNLGHDSSISSFGLLYDNTTPNLYFQINNGAATTQQTNVLLNLSASDTGSGVADVRISNNGLTWSGWQPYDDTISWSLPSLDRRELPVYVQVRDRAGNESAVISDTITLDLYPPMPHSDNFRICQNVLNVGGSAGLTSPSYALISSIGEPWSTGAGANTSDGFSERSGFLAGLSGCLPITRTWTNIYTVTQSVIAAGGNLRSSASYRLGDTTGQPAASEHGAFTSANYQLTSGFWAQITGTVPPTLTQPTPVPVTPTPTPTPGPTPTPQPTGFGLSIDNGALFTNDPVVKVRSWAPNITHMRLSNDGGYAEESWMTYQLTRTWVISTYGNTVMPRYVYAWFKDSAGSIYGPYFDDIIYDPVPPEGQVTILGGETTTVTLWLEAWDDNSGIASMRVAEDRDALTAGAWQPFTDTLDWNLQSNKVYAQFQDQATNTSLIYGTDGSTYDPYADREYVYLPLVIKQ